MSSAPANTLQNIQVLIAAMLCCSWITGIHGVSITDAKTNTPATSHDPFVTLPCNFTTNSLESPRITWFRYRGEQRVLVMRFENNRLFSYQELLGRVARGDKGALVLIRPSVNDTGKYSCEVEVERERPGWVKTDLVLNVTRPKVTVTKTENPVTTADTDVFVTLPCDYRTNDPAPPRITWHLVKGSKDTRGIAVFNKDDRVTVGDQFVGRVARGNRGDLMLISPRVEDSGTYKCTIQVDDGTPVTADVKLSVLRNRNVFIPGQSSGLEVFVCILWIIPVFCGFVLEEKRFAQIIHIIRTNFVPKELVIKGWRYIVIVLALCLIFSGTAFSVKALRSQDQTDFNYNRAVGYGTGIVGIVVLCGVYIYVALTKFCKVKCSRKDTTEKSCDNADVEKTNDPVKTVDDCADRLEQEQSNLIPEVEGNKTNSADCAVPTTSYKPTADKEVKQPKIVTLDILKNEKVTWMTSLSAEVAYFTAQGRLYRQYLSPESNRSELTMELEQDEQLLMVSKRERGLLLLAKQLVKKNASRELYDKYSLLSVEFKGKKVCKIRTEHPMSFVLSQIHSEDIYVIYPNTQRIIKTMIKGEKFHNSRVLNTRVLKNPSCIVKNSREQIIVTDSEKNDVFVFDEDTGLVTSMKISVPKDLEPELECCNILAVGTDDRIYVTSPFTRRVFVFGADFRFERVIETGTETSGQISCLMVHDNSLYVAHSACIRVHPLSGN